MQKKIIKKKLVLKPHIKIFISRLLISIILFLSLSILVKNNEDNKKYIKEKVYEENFEFTKFKSFYEKYFGNILSIDKIVQEEQPVFNEKISYQNKKEYNDGVELTVSNNYLVPAIESGIVVYIGDKENFGTTIIIEQVNGIDVFYSNIEPININIYDYIEKGELLGQVKTNKLYMLFQKDGKNIDYKDYV